jgi:repressor of nif and glnA expression
MPISAAAMDGIRDNGLRWRYRMNGLLKSETAKLGEFNDRIDGQDDDDQLIVLRSESEPVVMEIVRKVRGWLNDNKRAVPIAARLPAHARDSLAARLDDLECVEDCAIQEINFAMNELYDEFDYWRVLT